MRKATLVTAVTLLGFSASAVLATLGFLTSNRVFFLLVIWVLTLNFVALCVFVLKIYKLTANRTRQTVELLQRLELLGERRYEKLAARLDTLSLRRSASTSPAAPAELVEVAALDAIEARLQGAERRIMGKLENEALVADQKIRALQEFVLNTRNQSANAADERSTD